MGWIVGVEGGNSPLKLVEVIDGSRRSVAPVDSSLQVPQPSGRSRRTCYFAVDTASMKRMSFDKARELVAALGLPVDIEEVQSFFAFEQAHRRFVIASQVLIHALLGTSTATRSALFSPAGYESHAQLVEADGALGVDSWSSFDGKPLTRFEGFSENALWSGCYRSAKQMVSSVLREALHGRFDIDLPAAKLTMCFNGVDLPDGRLFISRAYRAIVEPLEPPMSHARGLVPESFIYAKVESSSVFKGEAAVGRRGAWSDESDGELAHERFAAPLSETEWDAVRPVLEAHMNRPRQLGQREWDKVNLILRKQSTGKHWTKIASSACQAELVRLYFSFLKRNGSWVELKKYLRQARPGPAEVQPPEDEASDSVSYSPRHLKSLRIDVAKMTQAQLAELLGVTVRNWSKWENGRSAPTRKAGRKALQLLRLLELGGVEALLKKRSQRR